MKHLILEPFQWRSSVKTLILSVIVQWLINEALEYIDVMEGILTVQTIKFLIKNFFSKCDPIRSFLRIWSHLLKMSLMQNFIFCTMSGSQMTSFFVQCLVHKWRIALHRHHWRYSGAFIWRWIIKIPEMRSIASVFLWILPNIPEQPLYRSPMDTCICPFTKKGLSIGAIFLWILRYFS